MAKRSEHKDYIFPHITDDPMYWFVCEEDCCQANNDNLDLEDVEESICLIRELIFDAIERRDEEEVHWLRGMLNAAKVLKREKKSA